MKILAWAVGKTDLGDKNKDVNKDPGNKDPGNKDPSKKDIVINMGVRATSDGRKSSKLVQGKKTNRTNQPIRRDKCDWVLLIILIGTMVVGSVMHYFRWRSEQAL